ncbi:putative reverse transcriptase [Operophtera brumata]|uniref:Putative reverse transcriptase n=1 Tax=Operophtera brumata TaxID=104452 RepID=A0A0L7KZ47_OPEBR|nr:putative reverse transcriptase [Operophtera brumata]
MNMNIIYEVPVPVDSTPVQVLNHDLHHQPLHDGEIPVIVNMQPVPPEPPQPPDEKKPIVIKQEKKKKEAIDGQAKEVIYRVIKFFESEKQNRGYAFPVENVVKRACAATGLSESTIKRIKRDGIRAEATQTKMTGPKKKRMRKCKVQLDYFQLCALRGIVNSYNIQKEVPTLGKILAAARNELNYTGGKESLRLILLNKLGIKFKKCEKKNKKPPEQPPPPPPQVQQIIQPTMMIQHPPMQQQMKQPETMCVYSHMMPHVPPVSY